MPDIMSFEVQFTDVGGNLVMSVRDTEDTLTISNFRWGQGTYEFRFADGGVGTVDRNSGEFVFSTEPLFDEEELNRMYEALKDLKFNLGDYSIKILGDNAPESDITDKQVMILTENMAGFSEECNVFDNMLIDITSDSLSAAQLFMSSPSDR